jgi:HEAT repeat protein
MKKLLLVSFAFLLAGCGGKSTGDWVEQLRSRDSAQRLHAARALGDRGTEAPVVVPALADALKDEDAFVRREAAHSLGKIGPDAKPAASALMGALRDRKPDVRKAAGESLKNIDPETAARVGVR